MLGNVIVIFAAVVLLSALFLTDSLSFSDFGLDFVPAFDGDTDADDSIEGAGGVWALATPVRQRASVAVAATRRDLRKERLRCRCWTLGGRRDAAPRRGLLTTRQTRKGFAASVAGSMRADGPSIAAPPFPRNLPWINVAMLRMDQQAGFPVLVEFWDFCRVNSLRTLPYLKAWHERYAEAGLRIVGIHTGGFTPGAGRRQRSPSRRAARDPLGGRDRHRARGLGPLRQRGLAGALPVGARPLAVLAALRRGRLRRDRARDPGAAGRVARAAGAGAPRGRSGRADRRPDRGPAGRLLRPVRGGRRCGPSSRARVCCASTTCRSRSQSRAASS